MENHIDLRLVKLPKIPNIDQDFFGIGYYSDDSFVFSLITEKMFYLSPLRNILLPPYPDHDIEYNIEILGTIRDLPKNLKRKVET